MRDLLTRLRYRIVPDHVLGEILAKNWIDNAIPFVILVATLAIFEALIPGLLTVRGLGGMAAQFGELLLVTLAMTVVMLAGGIDLSVGSVFALANFVTLALFNMLGWPILVVIPVVLACGAAVGIVNGILIGYLRLRAFLTTLVSLIIVRSIVDMLILAYAVKVARPTTRSAIWDFISFSKIGGLPASLWAAIAVAIVLHLMLTRLRPGWRILAVGGSRRSAYNAGLPVRRTVATTYVISGVLSAAAGIFYASRLNAAGSDTGVGLEVLALTAAVVGGNSLGGGRGSVFKAVLGAIIVLIVSNSLIRLGLPTGGSSFVLGLVLLAAVAIDVRWLKNRAKVLSRVYVAPTYLSLAPSPETAERSASPYAVNDKLRDVELIGLGEIEGPEDPILDAEGHLYSGTRQGDIVRFLAPDHRRRELFVHTGGHPLGMAFDKAGNLVACIAGMGLYAIAPDRTVTKLSDQTNRSWFSVIDDSRMRLADDLDIAPDGRIFFSEATIRFDMSEWMVDALEARGNGRIICFDPRNGSTRTVIPKLRFPNGICMARDGQSFFFAETWGCSISRYWFAGPKQGRREIVIPDLPGYPDNINRASDGGYWLALVGMRTPMFDMALRRPDVRKRMVERVAPDEWLFPNMNSGCVVKFDESGRITDCLWDRHGVNHPMITSMREDRGWLYLGGVSNNRIGRYRIPGADPGWTAAASYRGDKP
ncbi:ABC transporter permease [Labrys wisconsinensis]|uniref:Ribose transport system permease protein n=1 Tax=Labrys wisconsinensis TaxID=425677 RepID=A0ABU0JIC7_9HYPH|nr:SMP-30/gluconolactonase/LRE family protein [Labrys wisconsinensis]MDQ0474040.1 ribose transport system permease protein [Labrys wisconsinensis]